MVRLDVDIAKPQPPVPSRRVSSTAEVSKEINAMREGDIYEVEFVGSQLGLHVGRCPDGIEVIGYTSAVDPLVESIVTVGDLLAAVNETSTEGMNFTDVLTTIKTSGRPVRLSFRRGRQQREIDPADSIPSYVPRRKDGHRRFSFILDVQSPDEMRKRKENPVAATANPSALPSILSGEPAFRRWSSPSIVNAASLGGMARFSFLELLVCEASRSIYGIFLAQNKAQWLLSLTLISMEITSSKEGHASMSDPSHEGNVLKQTRHPLYSKRKLAELAVRIFASKSESNNALPTPLDSAIFTRIERILSSSLEAKSPAKPGLKEQKKGGASITLEAFISDNSLPAVSPCKTHVETEPIQHQFAVDTTNAALVQEFRKLLQACAEVHERDWFPRLKSSDLFRHIIDDVKRTRNKKAPFDAVLEAINACQLPSGLVTLQLPSASDMVLLQKGTTNSSCGRKAKPETIAHPSATRSSKKGGGCVLPLPARLIALEFAVVDPRFFTIPVEGNAEDVQSTSSSSSGHSIRTADVAGSSGSPGSAFVLRILRQKQSAKHPIKSTFEERNKDETTKCLSNGKDDVGDKNDDISAAKLEVEGPLVAEREASAEDNRDEEIVEMDSIENISMENTDLFFLPNNQLVVESKKEPQSMTFNFILDQTGRNVFGACHVRYRQISQDRACEKPQENQHEEQNTGRLEANAESNCYSLYAAEGVCLVSCVPLVRKLRQRLQEHLATTQFPLTSEVLDKLVVPIPIPEMPQDKHILPPIDFSMQVLFECLSIGTIIDVLKYILLEKKILFLSQSYSVLVNIGESFRALISPLIWWHIYVPLLPRAMLEHLECPAPFIIGMNSGDIETKDISQIPDLVVVNLDEGSMSHTGSDVKDALSTTMLPNRKQLLHEVSLLVKRHWAVGDSLCGDWSDSAPHAPLDIDAIRKVFLKHVSKFLHRYTECGILCSSAHPRMQGSCVIFDVEHFLSIHPSDSKNFLSQLTNTQAFCSYVGMSYSAMAFPGCQNTL